MKNCNSYLQDQSLCSLKIDTITEDIYFNEIEYSFVYLEINVNNNIQFDMIMHTPSDDYLSVDIKSPLFDNEWIEDIKVPYFTIENWKDKTVILWIRDSIDYFYSLFNKHALCFRKFNYSSEQEDY